MKGEGDMQQGSSAGNVPLRSRSSHFYERYAGAEHENVQMRLAIGLLALLLVAVLGSFVYSSTRPRPVYYVPGAVSAGLAYADTVPVSSVRSFALAWFMSWMNYTPETVEGVYARALKYMAPGLLSQVRGRAAEEFEKIRRDRLSSVFMMDDEPKAENDNGVFKVTLTGRRGIYMGKEEMSSEKQVYVIVISKTPSTEDNLYGLAVNDIQKEEAGGAGE
jgi:hypothetical protein